MSLLVLIFAPLVIGLINYLLGGKSTRYVAGLLQTFVFGFTAFLFYKVRFLGGDFVFITGSVGFLGIPLTVNKLSALFVLLTSFIFAVALLYTLSSETTHRLFVFLLFSLQSLFFTAFLSDDLFNLYLSLEIGAIVCSMLILYNRSQRSFYDGLIYLLINMVGMLFFLMGIGYLYKIFGVLNMSALASRISELENAQILALPYAFLMTGICLKCAFMPLFSWLPKAHGTPGAPSVISAILSGVYIKCGIYLFIRARLMFLPIINMDTFFLFIGFATGILGIVAALLQTDIKLILAYHTVSQMGLILIGISLASEYAFSGAVLHIVNHALFKSLLFLCAGIIIKSYGTRNIYRIRAVIKTMPAVSAALIAGILGITGAPFFNGSISKYFIQSAGNSFAWWAESAIILINIGTVLSFVKFGTMLFGKTEKSYLQDAEFNKDSRPAVSALLILALCCLGTGLFAQNFMNFALGYAFPINKISYVKKAVVWFFTLLCGIGFYKSFLSRFTFFKRSHTPDFSFGTMNLCTLLFFATLLLIVLKL